MALFWIFVSLFSWLRDAFRSSSIKHLFANCRKDPFFIRTWVGNHRKHCWKTIKISWNLFQNRSKIVQGTFWWPSGAPWGAQGVPDWILGVKSWFVGPPLDPQMGSIFRFFFNAKFIRFFVWSQLPAAITRSGPGEDGFPRTGRRIDLGSFLFPFGSILGSLFYPFCIQFSFNF